MTEKYPLSRLGYQERIDAVHAAMQLVQEAIDQGREWNPDAITYDTLLSWREVQANLCSVCVHFDDHQRRGDVEE